MAPSLSPGWHVSDHALKELLEETPEDGKKLETLIMNLDLKLFGLPSLQDKMDKNTGVVKGPIVLQITRMRDCGRPSLGESSSSNLLRVFLTDGHQAVSGLAMEKINGLSEEKTPWGTKILLKGEVKVEGQFIILTPSNVTVIGGRVDRLIERWSIEKSSMKGIGRKSGEDAPKWVSFGKRDNNAETIKNTKNFKANDVLKGATEKEEEEGEDQFEKARKEKLDAVEAAERKFAKVKVEAPKGGLSEEAKLEQMKEKMKKRGEKEEERREKRGMKGGRRGRRGSDDEPDVPSEFARPAQGITLSSFLGEGVAPPPTAAAPLFVAPPPPSTSGRGDRGDGGRGGRNERGGRGGGMNERGGRGGFDGGRGRGGTSDRGGRGRGGGGRDEGRGGYGRDERNGGGERRFDGDGQKRQMDDRREGGGRGGFEKREERGDGGRGGRSDRGEGRGGFSSGGRGGRDGHEGGRGGFDGGRGGGGGSQSARDGGYGKDNNRVNSGDQGGYGSGRGGGERRDGGFSGQDARSDRGGGGGMNDGRGRGRGGFSGGRGGFDSGRGGFDNGRGGFNGNGRGGFDSGRGGRGGFDGGRGRGGGGNGSGMSRGGRQEGSQSNRMEKIPSLMSETDFPSVDGLSRGMGGMKIGGGMYSDDRRGGGEIKAGSRVKAPAEDGNFYPATVLTIVSGTMATVRFDGYDHFMTLPLGVLLQ